MIFDLESEHAEIAFDPEFMHVPFDCRVCHELHLGGLEADARQGHSLSAD